MRYPPRGPPAPKTPINNRKNNRLEGQLDCFYAQRGERARTWGGGGLTSAFTVGDLLLGRLELTQTPGPNRDYTWPLAAQTNACGRDLSSTAASNDAFIPL